MRVSISRTHVVWLPHSSEQTGNCVIESILVTLFGPETRPDTEFRKRMMSLFILIGHVGLYVSMVHQYNNFTKNTAQEKSPCCSDSRHEAHASTYAVLLLWNIHGIVATQTLLFWRTWVSQPTLLVIGWPDNLRVIRLTSGELSETKSRNIHLVFTMTS